MINTQFFNEEKILGGVIFRILPIYMYLLYINNLFENKNQIYITILYLFY